MLILNWHQINVQKSPDGVLSRGFPPVLQVKVALCAELAQAKIWIFFPHYLTLRFHPPPAGLHLVTLIHAHALLEPEYFATKCPEPNYKQSPVYPLWAHVSPAAN